MLKHPLNFLGFVLFACLFFCFVFCYLPKNSPSADLQVTTSHTPRDKPVQFLMECEPLLLATTKYSSLNTSFASFLISFFL